MRLDGLELTIAIDIAVYGGNAAAGGRAAGSKPLPLRLGAPGGPEPVDRWLDATFRVAAPDGRFLVDSLLGDCLTIREGAELAAWLRYAAAGGRNGWGRSAISFAEPDLEFDSRSSPVEEDALEIRVTTPLFGAYVTTVALDNIVRAAHALETELLAVVPREAEGDLLLLIEVGRAAR